MASNRRSPEAEQWRKYYRTARWIRLRAMQLNSTNRLCEWCKRKTATVCHHNNPKDKEHGSTFFRGPFTSLCAECHDTEAKQIEARGYSTRIGVDGVPTDPKHPANWMAAR